MKNLDKFSKQIFSKAILEFGQSLGVSQGKINPETTAVLEKLTERLVDSIDFHLLIFGIMISASEQRFTPSELSKRVVITGMMLGWAAAQIQFEEQELERLMKQ